MSWEVLAGRSQPVSDDRGELFNFYSCRLFPSIEPFS